MLHKRCIGLLFLLGCCLLKVSSRPSDDTTTQYLPFYGGAKGQYLEIKTDSRGTITSEKVVSEDEISKDNVVKNNAESLLSKILSANLVTLRSLTTRVQKLHNLGRVTGFLNDQDKMQLKSQLKSLAETASNTIKTVEDINDDIDSLYKVSEAIGTKRQFSDSDYVVEEGVSVDNPDITDQVLQGATIAEAKPVGLAVIGESGLAASRPHAVAVALTGVAVARPVATAIAGINPADLNINYQINQDEEN